MHVFVKQEAGVKVSTNMLLELKPDQFRVFYFLSVALLTGLVIKQLLMYP